MTVNGGPGPGLRRAVTAADEASVGELVQATGFFSAEEVGIARELVRGRLQFGAASGYEFVFAEAGERLAGYACWGRTEQTVCGWDVYWLAVDPRLQRGGIGTLLMRHVEAEIAAAGGGDIWLETAGRDLYAPTRAFYERLDYTLEARLRDYYAVGDDKLIYVKRLG